MLRKLFVFILLSAASGIALHAQNAPTAPVEKRVQRMISSAPFEASYLGVQTQEITKENFSKFGLAAVRGVGIEKVAKNSPAARAGLQTGDVIVQFEGEEVTSVRKLTRLISEVAPDHTAKVTIVRGGAEREINVTMGKQELPKFENGFLRAGNLPMLLPGLPQSPMTMQSLPVPPVALGDRTVIVGRGASRQIGVNVAPLTKQLGDYFGAADGRGLLITSVRENSPAAQAGLKAGDVIVEADGNEIKGMMDFIRALNESKEGEISVTFIRDKNRQTVRVAPENSKGETMRFQDFEPFDKNDPNQMNFRFQTSPTPPEN